MPYIMEKKKGSMVLKAVEEAIADTYQSINLKDYYVNKYFRNSNLVSKSELPGVYSELDSLVDEVNLFKKRVSVPNKVFTADKPGKSCLRRSPSTGVICLSYRGKGGDKARTPNTCFITDDSNSSRSSWVCMGTFDKSVSLYTKGNVYSISPTHPDYKKWSDYMDSEYERLTGVKVERHEIRLKPTPTQEMLELRDSCELAYCYVPAKKDKELFCKLADSGLCRVNDKVTSLYDKDGYWICRFEEHPDGDNSSGEMINGVLSVLSLSELKGAYRVIKSLSDDLDILGGFNCCG